VRLRLREILDWIDALSIRERAAIGAATLLVLWGAWTVVAWDGIDAERAQTKQRLEAARSRLTELSRRTSAAAASSLEDPDASMREERERLLRQIGELDAELEARAGQLITPEQMVGTLRALLAEQHGLRLERLELQPPVSALTDDPGSHLERASLAEPGSAGIALYKHAIELEWLGGYLDTLRYLRAVERLGWTIYWESLEYEVVRHPEARVRLRLFTLSEHEGWIGV
jgi:MSHA biogenesis protein MshJ